MTRELSAWGNLQREARQVVVEALPDRAHRFLRSKIGRRRTLTSLDEVDEVLAEARALAGVRHDEATALLESVELAPPGGLPADPFSAAYRERQLELYSWLSGRREYAVDNEISVEAAQVAGHVWFPHSTGSTWAVGDELISQGFLLKLLHLPTQARILEVGSGWGNVTVHLAALGHDVVAIDINPAFAQLVRRRCDGLPGAVEARAGDMAAIELDGTFDAVIFNASFHHCLDHADLLRRLRGHIAPDGALLFAEEPVYGGFWCPWGMRLDGVSLQSIREHGWLELGFHRKYFDEVLAATGWAVERFESAAISRSTCVHRARPV